MAEQSHPHDANRRLIKHLVHERLRAPVTGTGGGLGLIGAGAFASTVLVPGLKAAGFERFVSVASASGSARRLAEREDGAAEEGLHDLSHFAFLVGLAP